MKKPHPRGTCTRTLRRPRGFTLLEILLVTAVLGILITLAIPSYRDYIERSKIAQLLVQIDQIATSVAVESATGVANLQVGAQLGKAPPLLRVVPDSAFSEIGGIKLLLIRAPAGFFGSWPRDATYGLVAELSSPDGARRLGLLNQELAFDSSDKLWLSPTQLAFPLRGGLQAAAIRASTSSASQPQAPASSPQPTASASQTPASAVVAGSRPSTPGTGWNATSVLAGNGTWTCEGSVAIMGNDQQPLTGDAGVRIRVTMSVTTWDGSKTERSWSDTGHLASGKAGFSLGGLSAQASKGEVVTACRLEVVGVDYYWPTNPAVKWDGVTASIQVALPSSAMVTR